MIIWFGDCSNQLSEQASIYHKLLFLVDKMSQTHLNFLIRDNLNLMVVQNLDLQM